MGPAAKGANTPTESIEISSVLGTVPPTSVPGACPSALDAAVSGHAERDAGGSDGGGESHRLTTATRIRTWTISRRVPRTRKMSTRLPYKRRLTATRPLARVFVPNLRSLRAPT